MQLTLRSGTWWVVIGPDAMRLTSASAVACTDEENGSISWAPTGGAEGFEVVVGDSTLTGSSYDGLGVGFYTIEVTDANGCEATEIVEVLNAESIVVSTEVTNALCYGGDEGEVVITATGGTGAFQYSDDGNDFSNDNTFDDFQAGNYTFYAQDENGCIVGASAEVEEPLKWLLLVSYLALMFFGAKALSMLVLLEAPDYTYEWTGQT